MTKESYSKLLNTYIMNGFVRSFNMETDQVWKPLTDYVTGDVVSHSIIDGFSTVTSQYIAMNDGKSGTNPPLHRVKGKVASDGNVRWMFVADAVSTANIPSNIYLTFGKPTAWQDENNPDEPDLSIKAGIETIKNIIYARKVGKDAISMVIDRNTWESGKQFSSFDIQKESYPHPHYTVNNQGFIYYCLYNNNDKPSTVEPMGEGNEPINLLDGYIWLYIGKVENLSHSRFVTDDYIPINREMVISPYLYLHEGGFAALDLNLPQYGEFEDTDEYEYLLITPHNAFQTDNVEFFPIKNSAGVIEKIEIRKTGRNFSYPMKVGIYKKGERGHSGKLKLEITNGEITGVTVTNPGSTYTNGAVAIINGDGTGARIKLTTSTQGRIVDATIENGGSGYTEANTKAYIFSGKAAKLCNASLLPENLNERNVIKTLGEIDLMISLELAPSNRYFNYDVDFREVCLVANLANKWNREDLVSHEAIGAAHRDYDDNSSNLVKMDKEHGVVLYRMNTTKIAHVEGQTEKYKLVLEG